MLVVLGRFRFPPERIEEARPAMAEIVARSRGEPGCLAYSYAEDVSEPGLFRVSEAWNSRAALDAHFATSHMIRWQRERDALGFHDRSVTAYDVQREAPL